VQPSVVVVSGPPGSGKTSLAAALSTRLGWPVVSRDAVKAGMIDAERRQEPPPLGDPLAVKAYEVMYEIARRHVECGVSVIVESAFRVDLSKPELEAMTEGAEVRQIACYCPIELLIERFDARRTSDGRRRAHPDDAVLQLFRDASFGWHLYEPVELGAPLLQVDTTDGYNPCLDDIDFFARTASVPIARADDL